MSRLEGTDMRYFEVVPHPEVRGEKVLAEFVYSPIDGMQPRKYWDFDDVYNAMRRYEHEQQGARLR